MSLRARILNAERGIRVEEIVFPARADNLPPALRRVFLPMRIEWADNRNWGSSFQLGARTVKLGHRRGDHLATYPHLFGLSAEAAENILRIQLEGTLLHELGHAVVDAGLSPVLSEMVFGILEDEGPVSTYYGMGPRTDLFTRDGQHEALAEAFRYWCHRDPALWDLHPQTMSCIDMIVATASRRL